MEIGAARRGKLARQDDFYDDEFYDDEFDDEESTICRKNAVRDRAPLLEPHRPALALIAVFGMYIAKKNFDGDIARCSLPLEASSTKQRGRGRGPIPPGPAKRPKARCIRIDQRVYRSEHERGHFDIDIHTPKGSTIRFITDATLKEDTTTVPPMIM
jgi:hypothetical protein